jgi:glycosyltransferase involved in cell wall biosynthesis
MDSRNVSVILPCLNEAATLELMVDQIRAISESYEIIVVDNGSTDSTYAIARDLGVKIVKESKQGKGFAVRRGIFELNPDCKVVVLIDADDTYSLNGLDSAITIVNENKIDMLVGTRINQSENNGKRSQVFRPGHKLGNFILSLVSQVLHPSGVKDTLSGYRVLSRNFVNSFTGGASGFELEAELNAHAAFMSASVVNFEIGYKGRLLGSESKLRTFRDGYKILRVNFKVFRTYRPKIAYSILAFFWLLIAFVLGIEPVKVYFETGLVPRIPSLIASVGALIVSVQLWNTGMILERVNVVHLNQARNAYNLKSH